MRKKSDAEPWGGEAYWSQQPCLRKRCTAKMRGACGRRGYAQQRPGLAPVMLLVMAPPLGNTSTVMDRRYCWMGVVLVQLLCACVACLRRAACSSLQPSCHLGSGAVDCGAMSARGFPVSLRFSPTEYLPPSFDQHRAALAGAIFTRIDANTFHSGTLLSA